ncbi:hypothetical protein [Streptosporangium sp. NPDC000396]
MTTPDTLTEIENDIDSPWHGIPAELLDGTYSLDTDSAGGCG